MTGATVMRELIGSSTFMMTDQPFAQTIAMLAQDGFGLECVPAYTGSLNGMPHGSRGLDPDTWRTVLAGRDLAELKGRLSEVPFVTVHAAMSGKHTRVSSRNDDERRIGTERCLDAVRFGAAIGARNVTFHVGPTGARFFEERAAERRLLIDFCRRAADLAGELGVTVGTEIFDYQLIDEIGAANFGVLFDIGHAANVLPGSGPDDCADRVMELLQEAGDRIIQFHVHGVRWDGRHLGDHVSLALNECIDYRRVVSHVKQRRIRAPWIFEMQYELESSDAILAACRQARDFLVRCWNES